MPRSWDEVARFRTNKELYDANYEHIFGKKDTKGTEETSSDESIPESVDDSSHTTDETVVQVQGTVSE